MDLIVTYPRMAAEDLDGISIRHRMNLYIRRRCVTYGSMRSIQFDLISEWVTDGRTDKATFGTADHDFPPKRVSIISRSKLDYWSIDINLRFLSIFSPSSSSFSSVEKAAGEVCLFQISYLDPPNRLLRPTKVDRRERQEHKNYAFLELSVEFRSAVSII